MTEFEVVSSFHCAKSLTKRSSFVRLLEDNKRDASEKRGSGTTMSFPGKVMDIREGVSLGSCFPQRFKL